MSALAFTSSLRAQNFAVVADHLYTMDAGPQGARGWCSSATARSKMCGGSEHQAAQGVSGDPWRVRHAGTDRRGYHFTGVSGAYNIPADQDQDESTEPNTADVNVRDSLNPEDLLYQYVNAYGVTTLQVTPGPRNPIAGRAGIFKTAGPHSPFRTVDQLTVRLNSGMVFNLGESPRKFTEKPTSPGHTHEDGGDDP